MKFIALLSCTVALFLISCSDDPTSPSTSSVLDDLYEHTTVEVEDMSVTMYSREPSLTNGFNELHFTVAMDGELIGISHIEITPQMSMMSGMQHGAPTGLFSQVGEFGIYRHGVLFTMPSESDTSWTLQLAISTVNHGVVSVEFPVVVEAGGLVDILNAGDNRLFASIERRAWQVGKQSFDLYMYSPQHHDFDPLSVDSLEFYPWMGSMGHGSSGNVQPVEIEAGKYSGEVNFSMTGPWQMHVVLHSGEFAGDTLTFEVDVQ